MKKYISFMLTIVLLINNLPIMALANNNLEKITKEEVQASVSKEIESHKASNNIIDEIEGERNKYKKTFLLDDGNYYSIISSNSLHELDNDNWENKTNFLNRSLNNCEDANRMVSSYLSSNPPTEEDEQFITFSPDSEEHNGEYSFDFYDNGDPQHLFIKPEYIDTFSSEDRVITEAKLHFSLSTQYDNVRLEAFEETYDWENDANNNSFDYTNIDTDILIDEISYDYVYPETNSSDELPIITDDFELDITNTYTKWERNTIDNNGICFRINADGGMPLASLSNFYISITYKYVASDNSKYTYHSYYFDKAGTLKINDITNSFSLAQDLANNNSSYLPIGITRYISSVSPSLDNNGNVGGCDNYSRELQCYNDIMQWRMPDSTFILFEKTNDTNHGYDIWKQITNNVNVSATLYVEHGTYPQQHNTDYSYCYIENNSNHMTYEFDSYGNLESIHDNNICETFSYGPYGITSIIDANGNEYEFYYSTYKIGTTTRHFMSSILFKNSNGIYDIDATIYINTTYNRTTKKITSTTTFEDDSTTSYIFDTNGLIEKIICEDSSVVDFNYKDKENPYLISFEQTQNNSIIKSLSINSTDIYSRIFTDETGSHENFYYNPAYQLISHKDASNNITTMTYGEDGGIYLYSTEKKNNLLYNLGNSKWIDYDNKLDLSGPKAKLNSSKNGSVKLGQTITPADNNSGNNTPFNAGDIIVFGLDFKLLNMYPITSEVRYICVCLKANFTNRTSTTYSIPLDTSILNNNQIALQAITLPNNCSKLEYSINICNEKGYVLINEPILFLGDKDNWLNFGVERSSVVNTEYNNDKNTVKESIEKDGLILEQNYSYDDNKTTINNYNNINRYYLYNNNTNTLAQSGYYLDSEGAIADPTSFTYSATGMLSSITSIVKTMDQLISNNSSINPSILTANYEYDNLNNIVAVTNNGIKYELSYDNDKITSLSVRNINVNNSNRTLSEYNYSGENINNILYADGSHVNYSYTNNLISEITYYEAQSSSPYCTYNYFYNNNRLNYIILHNTDNITNSNYKIQLTETGYKIYKIIDEDSESTQLLYSTSNSNNEFTEEFYNPNRQGHTESFTTLNYSKSNSYGNEETINIKGKKQYMFYQTDMNYDVNSTTSKDPLNRPVSQLFEAKLDNTNNNETINRDTLKIESNYQYQNISNDRTSTLISSSYCNINNTRIENPRKYIYDNQGNLHYIFEESTTNGRRYKLLRYYEYDTLNQLVKSHIYESGLRKYETYQYDNMGNMIKRTSFDIKPTVVVHNLGDNTNPFNNQFISSENINPESLSNTYVEMTARKYTETEFTYDQTYPDSLINYKETEFIIDAQDNITSETTKVNETINYDHNGNPLKYVGYNYNDTLIKGNLKWSNNRLVEFDVLDDNGNIESIYSYTYDIYGNRIEKKRYYVNNSQNILATITKYEWKNGKLQNIQYIGNTLSFRDNTPIDESMFSYTKILYNSDGEATGYIMPSGAIIGFVKDIDGSITGLVNAQGQNSVHIKYDARGNIKFTNTPNSSSGTVPLSVLYNNYMLLALFNPCTYKQSLYDYESGLYFINSNYYSANYSRMLSKDNELSYIKSNTSVINNNAYLFMNNNPNSDTNAYKSQNSTSRNINNIILNNGIKISINKAFLSRPVCTLYAAQILEEIGKKSLQNSNYNLDVDTIASIIFANTVAYYSPNSIRYTNANWLDGLEQSLSVTIRDNENTNLINNYKNIWYAAPTIRNYAISDGIYITV